MARNQGAVPFLNDSLLSQYDNVEVRQCRTLGEVYRALSSDDRSQVALVSNQALAPDRDLFEEVRNLLARGEPVHLALFTPRD